MTTHLRYDNQTRTETDETIIATLVRKGWEVYTPEPVVEVPVVPQSVTPLQMRKALRAAGLKSAVDAALAAQSEELREEWEFASEVRRDNATLTAFAASLGQTSADLDALFQLAAAK